MSRFGSLVSMLAAWIVTVTDERSDNPVRSGVTVTDEHGLIRVERDRTFEVGEAAAHLGQQMADLERCLGMRFVDQVCTGGGGGCG